MSLPKPHFPCDVFAGQVQQTTRGAFRLDDAPASIRMDAHPRDPVPSTRRWFTVEKGLGVPPVDALVVGYVRKGTTSVVGWE